MKFALRLVGTLGVLAMLGCSSGPEPIAWGVDTCEQCRMILTDKRFGAELVDARGRAYKFDGVDELAKFLAAKAIEGKAYVTHGAEGALVPAEAAVYLSSPDIRSPMGGSLMAFADRAEAEAFAGEQGFKDLRWLSYREAVEVPSDAHR